MKAGIAREGASLITMQVSRDGGRSFGRPTALAVSHEWAAENVDPLASLYADQWPPCLCPLHRQSSS